MTRLTSTISRVAALPMEPRAALAFRDLDKMSDDAAAKKWVDANKDKVDAWLK